MTFILKNYQRPQDRLKSGCPKCKHSTIRKISKSLYEKINGNKADNDSSEFYQCRNEDCFNVWEIK